MSEPTIPCNEDSSEYDDAAMVEHITEAREQARADAALDDYLSRMVA